MSKRILVVEDQPDNRQIIRDMLAPTDYQITESLVRRASLSRRCGADHATATVRWRLCR